MDKSGRRFVVHFQLIEQPKNLAEKTNQKTRNYNLDLSSQRGHATPKSSDNRSGTLTIPIFSQSGNNEVGLTLPLFDAGIPRSLLPRVSLVKLTFAPLRS